MKIANWECNEGYIRYENRCYKEGELPQEGIEREIAEFEAQLAAELALEEAKIEANIRIFVDGPDGYIIQGGVCKGVGCPN